MSAVASKLELWLLKQAVHSRHIVDASDEESSSLSDSEASVEEANPEASLGLFGTPEVEQWLAVQMKVGSSFRELNEWKFRFGDQLCIAS